MRGGGANPTPRVEVFFRMKPTPINDALSALWEKLEGWIHTFITLLPNLAVALLVLVVFALLSRWGSRLTESVLRRTSITVAARSLVTRVVRIGTFATGLLVALSVLQLDKTVTSLLAGVGIVGLALGFAFQDLASNFVAGVALSLGSRYPFRVGDLIETNGVLGLAEHVFLRNSVIRTLDGNAVVVPNKKIFEQQLTNFSADPYRRVAVTCGVSYGDDLRRVKALVLETVRGMDLLLSERPVDFYWTGYNDSSIDFEVRFWIPFKRQPDFLEARSEAVMRIKAAFDSHGITIPFPIRTLDFGIKGGQRLDQLQPLRLARMQDNEASSRAALADGQDGQPLTKPEV